MDPGPPNPSSTHDSSARPPRAQSSPGSTMFQPQDETADAAPASCFDFQLPPDDEPHLQQEPACGTCTPPAPECRPGRSFSLSSNAEQLTLYFAACAT